MTLPDLRTPPHDVEAEELLLGSILLGCEAADAILATVRAEDFYGTDARKAFEVFQTVAIRREPLEPGHVMAEAARAGFVPTPDLIDGKPSPVTVRAYLARLTNAVDEPAHAEGHAERIRSLATARAVIRVADDLRRAAYHDEGREESLIDLGESLLYALRRGTGDRAPVSMQGVVEEVYATIARGETPKGTVPTGFAELDVALGGLHPGQLVTVAGATSMGKTTFALNLVRHAIDEGVPVLLFSLEMSRHEVAKTMLAASARVSTTKMRVAGNVKDYELDRLLAIVQGRTHGLLKIADASDLNVGEIRAATKRDQRDRGTALVVADYCQLLEPIEGGPKSKTREQQVAEISRALKRLARDTGVPVVVLAQLNRDADKRAPNDRHPRLSDLRESAAIAHDSDVVLGVYRESYYQPTKMEFAGIMEACILKQRSGATLRVKLAYDAATSWLADLHPPKGA